MKKLLSAFLILAATGSSSLYAQIPNNGFENWTNAGAYNDPNQWSTLNALTSALSVYTCTKGTPGNPGSSYIKLTSQNAVITIAPGIATTGTINTTTFNVDGGFPYTQMPQSLTGNWQYMASGSDQGFIGVALTKWNTGTNSRDTVAWALHNLPGMVMSWASFTIPLTWNTLTPPDTCNIVLSSSGANNLAPVAGSYLYVDNLAFAGSVGINENKSTISGLTIFPVPANGKSTIEYMAANNEKTKMQVIDLTGKVVRELQFDSQKGLNKHPFETTGLSSGIYFVRNANSQMTEVRKIIIE